MDSDNPKALVCCVCSLAAILAMGTLVFMSYSSLDATEYGLDYSSITKTIDVNYKGSGFHYLGFGHSFIRYPSIQQTMEFSKDSKADFPQVESRTNDGL